MPLVLPSFDSDQHVAVLEQPLSYPPRKLEVGPIALVPEKNASDDFKEAIRAGGGMVGPLDEHTRAVIYLGITPQSLEEALCKHPNICWVQLPAAGVDYYGEMLKKHGARGVFFTSAKGNMAQPVAEHALMLTLSCLRLMKRRLTATKWNCDQQGRSLFKATVVLLGGGSIASALIPLLKPFSVNVIVIRRSDRPCDGANETYMVSKLADIVPRADVLIVCAASTAKSNGLINARILNTMKKTAILVNVSRGKIVDTNDLLDALNNDQLYGAAMDVTDPEPLPENHALWTHEKALITPHVADTATMRLPLNLHRVRFNTQAYVTGGKFAASVDTEAGY